MSYHCTIPVRLRHTDAAGVLFFTEQLALAHEAYEAFLDEHQLSVGEQLAAGTGAPIVSCEAAFMAPVRVGDRLIFAVSAEHIGQTSFTLTYQILREHDQQQVGSCRTVHVCVAEQGRKTPLSDAFRTALQTLV